MTEDLFREASFNTLRDLAHHVRIGQVQRLSLTKPGRVILQRIGYHLQESLLPDADPPWTPDTASVDSILKHVGGYDLSRRASQARRHAQRGIVDLEDTRIFTDASIGPNSTKIAFCTKEKEIGATRSINTYLTPKSAELLAIETALEYVQSKTRRFAFATVAVHTDCQAALRHTEKTLDIAPLVRSRRTTLDRLASEHGINVRLG